MLFLKFSVDLQQSFAGSVGLSFFYFPSLVLTSTNEFSLEPPSSCWSGAFWFGAQIYIGMATSRSTRATPKTYNGKPIEFMKMQESRPTACSLGRRFLFSCPRPDVLLVEVSRYDFESDNQHHDCLQYSQVTWSLDVEHGVIHDHLQSFDHVF